MGSGPAITATEFATVSRLLADTAGQHSTAAPRFRSPPRIPGVNRSVTRNRDRSVTVSVVVRNRPLIAVLADMVDGVVFAAAVEGAARTTLNDALWAAVQNWLDHRYLGSPARPHLTIAAA